MRHEDEVLLDKAVEILKSSGPADSAALASARMVADRLGIAAGDAFLAGAIESCGDVQGQLAAYRAGTLSEARLLLVEAHVRECGACLRQFKSSDGGPAMDWSMPQIGRDRTEKGRTSTEKPERPVWKAPVLGWALAPVCALLVGSFFVYRAYWQVPPGVRAEVQSADGAVYRIANDGGHALAAGDKLSEGEQLRTSGGGHAVLRLTDGSTVEVNERSVLGVGARGRNMTLTLDGGALIVQAAKRDVGHLYVKTPDCRVAVTGTVFSVNSGIKGSRVAVLQGSVHVEHAGEDSVVAAGSEVATNDNMLAGPAKEDISDEIAWSHDRDRYLPLLAQFGLLQHKIEQIPLPQARYTSDLLPRVPANTLLYVSIPNLGEFLSQADKIFDDQLAQSPELQQWWNDGHGHGSNTAMLDMVVDRLHAMSQYLGEEVVVVGVSPAGGVSATKQPGFAVVADVHKGGLEDFLKTLPLVSQSAGLVVLDEGSLGSEAKSSQQNNGLYALVREHEVVFSNSIATLTAINGQLNAGSSGFSSGDFGKQIAAAYGRGAGVILAADLHQMVESGLSHSGQRDNEALSKSGMDGVQYLIAEHREANGTPENHLNLQFSGTRQRVASWLAAPAAMGSLEFVTPNAAAAMTVLSKDPKAIADDIMDMTVPDKGEQQKDWNDADLMTQVNLRDDLAANLGGEFLIALDGPVLPVPSWKAVVEVHDAVRLEKTLEQLAQTISKGVHGEHARPLTIDSSEVSGQSFYAVRDVTSGTVIGNYTFADGYMIVAPSRALLIEAIHAHDSGDSLGRSASFKASLPKDENENYSAVAYQNLSPVITPLLSQLSGASAEALRKLAEDTKPTTVCAWGRDSRIEAASDSHLFGFDFLTLGALIHPNSHTLGSNLGNKHASASVRD